MRVGLPVVSGFLLAVFPLLVAEPGTVYVLTQIAIGAIFASSVAFVIGFTGVPTFGNQLFYGAGAYLVAYYSAIHGFRENLIVLVLALVLGAVLAGLVGSFLRGPGGFAFGMLTLAIAQTGYLFAFQTPYLRGADGIVGVSRGEVAGISLASSGAF